MLNKISRSKNITSNIKSNDEASSSQVSQAENRSVSNRNSPTNISVASSMSSLTIASSDKATNGPSASLLKTAGVSQAARQVVVEPEQEISSPRQKEVNLPRRLSGLNLNADVSNSTTSSTYSSVLESSDKATSELSVPFVKKAGVYRPASQVTGGSEQKSSSPRQIEIDSSPAQTPAQRLPNLNLNADMPDRLVSIKGNPVEINDTLQSSTSGRNIESKPVDLGVAQGKSSMLPQAEVVEYRELDNLGVRQGKTSGLPQTELAGYREQDTLDVIQEVGAPTPVLPLIGGPNALVQLQEHKDLYYPIVDVGLDPPTPAQLPNDAGQLAGYRALIGYSISNASICKDIGATAHQLGSTAVGSAIGFGLGFNATRIGVGSSIDIANDLANAAQSPLAAAQAAVKGVTGLAAGAIAGGIGQHVNERVITPVTNRAPYQYTEIPNTMLIPNIVDRLLRDDEREFFTNNIAADRKTASSLDSDRIALLGASSFGTAATAAVFAAADIGRQVASSLAPLATAATAVGFSAAGGLGTAALIAYGKYTGKTDVPILESTSLNPGDPNAAVVYSLRRNADDSLATQKVNLYYPHEMSAQDSDTKNRNLATTFARDTTAENISNTVEDIARKSAAIGTSFAIATAVNVAGEATLATNLTALGKQVVKPAIAFSAVMPAVAVYFKYAMGYFKKPPTTPVPANNANQNDPLPDNTNQV